VTLCDQLASYLKKFVAAEEAVEEKEEKDLSGALEGFKPMVVRLLPAVLLLPTCLLPLPCLLLVAPAAFPMPPLSTGVCAQVWTCGTLSVGMFVAAGSSRACS
jgi:hypothetical protein